MSLLRLPRFWRRSDPRVNPIRVDAFVRQTPKNAIITAVTAGTLWILLSRSVPLYLTVPWVVLHLASAGFLYINWFRRRAARHVRPASRKFLIRAHLWAGLSGALWGSTVLFFPFAAPPLQVAILVVVAAMAIGGATTLAALPGAAALFIGLSLVPTAVYFAFQTDIAFLGLSVLELVLCIGMLSSARAVYDALVRETDAHALSSALTDQFNEERQEWLDLSDNADGFALFDEQNRLMMWNRPFGQILGIGEDRLLRGAALPELLAAGAQPVDATGDKGKNWTTILQRTIEGSTETVAHLADGRWVQIRRNRTARKNTAFIFSDVTQLKEAERSAQEAYGRLEDAVFSMEQGIILYDSADRIVLFNDRFVDIYPGTRAIFEPGRSRHDALKEAAQLGLIGDPDSNATEILERILRRHARADGKPEIVGTRNGRIIQVRNVSTREGGLMSVATDVTDAIRREEATRQSRDQMRLVTDSLPVLIAYVGADSRYRFVNATCAAWYGAEQHEIIGRTATEILGPELAKLASTIEAAAAAGEEKQVETRIRYPDGRTRDIKAIFAPHTSPEGAILGHFELVEDLTEQKEVAAAASRSVGQFSALVDNSPNAILFANAEGRIQSANRPAEKLFSQGHTDSIVGLTLDQIGLDDEGRALPAVLSAGGIHQFESEHVLVDGDARRIFSSLFPVQNRDADLIGIGSINADVTSQRAAEVQLRQAQKMDAVGQLTGGIAHDFNNLLTVIIGNLELLQTKEQSDDDAERFLASSIKAARRGAGFTQRLLAFSRKQALRPESVRIDRLFIDLVQLMKRTLGEKVEILASAANVPPTLVDRNQLENALLNLAVNARDAMPDGGRLWLTARPSDLEGLPFVLIEVTDEGSGMSADVLSRAIEPFYTTKPAGSGTGLGLSMVYGFARQSGGRFEIDSEEGAGTTVRLYLPVAPEHTRAEAPRDSPATDLPLGTERILVVEDDPDVREIAVAALSSLGYQVIQAGDGPTAVTVAADIDDLDLLLTDVVLPKGMSGPVVSEEIKRLFPGIKVLFMSGYSGDALLEHGALRPGIELLSKPYSKSALARRVRSVLDRR